MPGLDLHLHSTASDGDFSPTQIAQAAGDLELLAICDHERVEGSLELVARLPGQAVLGLEMLTRTPDGHADLLAIGIRDPAPLTARIDAPAIANWVATLIAKRLAELGFALLEAPTTPIFRSPSNFVGGRAVGHPANAARLAAEGIDSLVAFRRAYLFKGRPGSVSNEVVVSPLILDTAAAIALIRAAGAVATLAHPAVGPDESPHFERHLASWVAAGLEGLEVWHPAHDRAAVARYLALTRRYGLLAAAGSDSHDRLRLGAFGPPDPAPLVAAWRERLGR